MRYILGCCFGLCLTACSLTNSSGVSLSDNMGSQALTDNTARQFVSYADRPDVQQFIQIMVERHQFDATSLQMAFSTIAPRQSVVEKSNNQPEVITPYYQYKQRFLDAGRIQTGKRFVQENRYWLEKAQQEFGVPIEIIAAILGVETYYGRVTGNRDVFTSLTTLAFDYPRRRVYFQSELEAYLLLTRAQQWSIGGSKGSFSGALGAAQFMPSNYLRLAIDYDTDGKVDLWHIPDAIGSVANYLRQQNWQPQRPLVVSAVVDGQLARQTGVLDWVNKGRRTEKTLAQWQALGVTTSAAIEPDRLLGLIGLYSADQELSYWLAYDNFFALMHYNPSRRYTMAVIELAEAIVSP